jgi:hypothetical protein
MKETPVPFVPSDEQIKYARAIQWLYWGPRRGGRSTAIVYAALLYAMQHPGHRVYLADHYPVEDRREPRLLRLLHDMWEAWDPTVRKRFTLDTNVAANAFSLMPVIDPAYHPVFDAKDLPND